MTRGIPAAAATLVLLLGILPGFARGAHTFVSAISAFADESSGAHGPGGVLAPVAARSPATGGHPIARQMAVFGLALEKAAFRDAERILGRAEVRHNGGDAAGSAHFACYRGSDGTVLLLISSGEMGGGTELTAYRLAVRESLADYSWETYEMPARLRPRCAPLRRLSRGTRTDGGLRLGMTREDVTRLLGQPSQAGPARLAFSLETRIPMTQAEIRKLHGPDAKAGGSNDRETATTEAYWDRYQFLEVRFERDRLVAIRASQGTTF